MGKTIILPGISNPVDLDSPIYSGSYFTWGEATKNGRRIPEKTNIDGMTIAATQITANIIKLAKELDVVRARFGDRPITITSWYRDSITNHDVGGVRNSQHRYGWAADFIVQGLDPHDVADELTIWWKGGLGDSRDFTHADLRHLMGQNAARWNYGNA
jgi:Peptidase M15